jgi:hypothetical protein
MMAALVSGDDDKGTLTILRISFGFQSWPHDHLPVY